MDGYQYTMLLIRPGVPDRPQHENRKIKEKLLIIFVVPGEEAVKSIGKGLQVFFV